MKFVPFLKVVIIVYAFWYIINIVLDLSKGNKTNDKGIKKTIEIIKPDAVTEDNANELEQHETAPRRVGLDWDDDKEQVPNDDASRFMPKQSEATIFQEQEIEEIPQTVVADENEATEIEIENNLQSEINMETIGNEGYSLAELLTINMEEFENAA